MARPTKKGMDYFPLDVTLSDEVEAVEALHGNDGFTVIIKTWQALYQTDDGKLDCSGVLRRRTLAKRANISEELWKSIIDTCVEAGLFDERLWVDDQIITSSGVAKRMAKVAEEREKGRERAGKRWEKSFTPKNDAENDAENDGSESESEKESEKEIERGIECVNGPQPKKRFVVPEKQEVATFFAEAGSTTDEAGKFWYYYDSNGWMVGRNKMKSWESAAHKWIANTKKFNTNSNGKQRKGDSADTWNAEFADLENRLQGSWNPDCQELP